MSTGSTEQTCKTRLVRDEPARTDAFGPHGRIASAIRDTIEYEAGGRTIGLTGSYGSGKSTVVNLLEKELDSLPTKEHRMVWVFDAWAHDGDPLRRTFLEDLTRKLLARDWVPAGRTQYWTGPVRPGSSTHAELMLQGPHTGYSLYSDRDIYRFGLESRSFSIQLGDRVYALSPLTEAGREGVGATARVRAGPIEAGGFYQRDRRSETGSEQQAAFTRLHLGNVASIGANWLHHQHDYLPDRDVVSAQGALRAPGGWFNAEGEYGSRLGGTARAHSALVRAGTRAFAVQLRHVRADSAYGGAHAGSRFDAAHVALRPWRELFLELSADERGSNRVIAGNEYSHAERSARAALGYGGAAGEVRYYSGTRSTIWGAADRTSHSAALRLHLSLGPLSLVPRVEAGRSLDGLTDTRDTFWRASSQASLSTRSGSYTAGFEYFTGGTLQSAGSGEGVSASLSASVHPVGPMRLALSARGTRYFDRSAASLFANASLERRLPFGHTIAFGASVRGATGLFDSHETRLMLDYSIPLNVPIGGAPPSGSVSGRIHDGISGAPLEKVIVEIGGRRAATDSRGYFEIRGLPTGVHRIRLDRSSAGTHRVPSEFLPDDLEIRAGSKAMLDIDMVPAARLEGRVVLARQTAAAVAASSAPSELEGLSGAVVELTRGAERLRRTTDRAGRFEISNLRPGRWAITVISARLPQHYRFEQDTVFVDARAGEDTAVELRSVGVGRRVRMIATAEITVTANEVNEVPSPRSSGSTANERSSGSRASAGTIVSGASSPPAAAATVSAPRSGAAPAGSMAHRPDSELPSGWTLYTVPAYVSMLRGVAREVYLETGLWPRIWLANRDAVPDPDHIVPGSVLRIPPKAPLSKREEQALYDYMRSRW